MLKILPTLSGHFSALLQVFAGLPGDGRPDSWHGGAEVNLAAPG